MSETELLNLLDSAEAEMRANEDVFFDLWNRSIRENLRCGESFSIRDHVGKCGGFRLRLTEVDMLAPALRNFFGRRGHVEGDTVWLRGYEYYECDPQMHEKRSDPTERFLWHVFRDHWKAYSEPIFTCPGEPWTLDVVNWIGMLSYLEYLFNDLTTMLWFALSNEPGVRDLPSGSHVVPTIEACITDIADMIASLLLFRSPAIKDDMPRRIAAVVLDPTLSKFLDDSLRISPLVPGSVRAVREGDSLPALYAAFTTKLAAFTRGPEPDRVMFLSNAFGGLNLGVILQRLTSDRRRTHHVNVHYSQHRSPGAHRGERSGTVRAFGARSVAELVDEYRGGHVIVVDDCIFTGKSFKEIRDLFDPNTAVMPLPLMLDTQSLRYYRGDTRDPQEAYDTARGAVTSARELGERLPAFQALWDWNTHECDTQLQVSSEFDEVMSGGDVLLRTLWSRFRHRILTAPAMASST